MVANQRINLAKMIISRLRTALGRKSTPISYGMHLMVLMEKAGVDLRCSGEKEEIISAPIDHHTLRRLGYKQQYGGWDFVGKGTATTSNLREGQGEHGEEEHEEGQEEGNQEHTQAESSAPSRSRPTHIPPNLRFQSQNLATKTDIAHLQHFLVEQLHLMQATLLSKLDSLDSRVQNCETHLRIHHPSSPSPIPHPTTDPKGKGPMPYPSPSRQQTASSPHSPIIPSSYQSPIPSPHYSPISPSHHSSQPIPVPSPQPIPVPSTSSGTSSSSSVPSPSHYTIAPHTTTSQASIDSEATQSNPPSKTPSPTHPTTTPPTPPPIPHPTSQPPPPPKPASPPVTTAYQRRRVAVSKFFPPNVPRLMPPP